MGNITENRSSSGGNVLFLILIAVALFAALSYAVTTSSRGGSQTDKEAKFLSSARIAEIGSAMSRDAMRMVLTGTSIQNIVLHDAVGPDQTLPCTSGIDCLFAIDGGGANFPDLPYHVEKGVAGLPPIIYLFEIADGATVDGISDGQPLLLMQIRNLNGDVCREINKGLGISPMPQQLVASVWTGTMTAVSGEWAACVKSIALDDYTYYHVLATP